MARYDKRTKVAKQLRNLSIRLGASRTGARFGAPAVFRSNNVTS